MKRKDWILIAILLIAAAALAGSYAVKNKIAASASNSYGKTAEIRIDGEIYKRLSLDQTYEETIQTEWGTNHMSIADGTVSVTDADCPDKYCIKQNGITAVGDMIVCLPHHLVIEITAGNTVDSTAYDAVAE